MVKLLETHDEGELAFMKSLLEANNIPFFVQNEHFGSLYPGFAVSFNSRIIMVNEFDMVRARTLLREFIDRDESEEAS